MIVKLTKPYVRVNEVLQPGEHDLDEYHAQRAKDYGCIAKQRRKKVAKPSRTGEPIELALEPEAQSGKQNTDRPDYH